MYSKYPFMKRVWSIKKEDETDEEDEDDDDEISYPSIILPNLYLGDEECALDEVSSTFINRLPQIYFHIRKF